MLHVNQRKYSYIPYPQLMDEPDNPYGKKASVRGGGCGLCSACMIVDQLTTQKLPVRECAELSMRIGAAMGLTIESDPAIGVRQGYMAANNYTTGYSLAPGFKGILAQTQLDYRYYNEDAGYGLVLWIDMADRLGLAVPNMRAMLQIVSSIMGRDYKAEKARTLDTLGLDGYTMEQLLKIL